jgi:hypothetical protein
VGEGVLHAIEGAARMPQEDYFDAVGVRKLAQAFHRLEGCVRVDEN